MMGSQLTTIQAEPPNTAAEGPPPDEIQIHAVGLSGQELCSVRLVASSNISKLKAAFKAKMPPIPPGKQQCLMLNGKILRDEILSSLGSGDLTLQMLFMDVPDGEMMVFQLIGNNTSEVTLAKVGIDDDGLFMLDGKQVFVTLALEKMCRGSFNPETKHLVYENVGSSSNWKHEGVLTEGESFELLATKLSPPHTSYPCKGKLIKFWDEL
eukprot:TRINITY_DN63320_c0_g1_i1.p1 TRINITY_DN63320_c0_g1~~TRINITY_DN63320_c0_g1_i1.p1  ORF type:complete len:218 (+),score=52.81 TRINITY_DN63320_c0_g1_i1:26-655(+)